jgi:hypothetical protein
MSCMSCARDFVVYCRCDFLLKLINVLWILKHFTLYHMKLICKGDCVLKHRVMMTHGGGGNISRIINQLHAPVDLSFINEPPTQNVVRFQWWSGFGVKVNRSYSARVHTFVFQLVASQFVDLATNSHNLYKICVCSWTLININMCS